MPRGDHSGPLGEGPMSGRALGYCAGYDRPGFANGPGYGMGRGFGWGNGWGRGARGFGYGGRGMAWGRGWGYGPRGYYEGYGPYGAAPLSRENRKEILQNEAKAMEERLRFLKQEMDAIDEEKE